ncbi:MAG: carboxypeptidase regulatory-like domain-containing protein [Acidobacteria bacterium]|nr:carboxypeptidase regulatory-like domain-containing protein [Acidobacteriota bacterium]
MDHTLRKSGTTAVRHLLSGRFAIALLVALTLCGATVLHAQSVTGSIYGTITDPTGASIPGATVTIVNVGTNDTLTAKTDNSGTFVFPVVNPGTYKATATMAGFQTMTQNDLRLSANQNVNASFSMKPGEVSTEVSVDATAALVDTRESQLAQTIDQKRIVDLPLIGRNAYDLVTLVPGVTNYNASAQIGDTSGTQFSTNGTRPNFNTFYLDGAFNTEFYRGGGNVAPAPDALAEFRIITSNYDAEFGRYPGAVVNTVTRSGTNKIHGSAYDYLRNQVLNGKPYFQAPGAPVQYIYNVFGGGLGGPLLKDKLFAFGNYQGIRIHQQTVITSSAMVVPTEAERAGDFSTSTKIPKFLPPGTNCGTATAPKICPNAIDPAAKAILAYVPHPTDPNGTAPAQQTAPSPTIANQGTGRLDYQWNQANQIRFTYFNSQGTGYNRTQNSNQLLNFAGASTYAGQTNYILGETWTISPTMVNTATVFYTLNKSILQNIYSTPLLSDLGFAFPYGGALQTQPQFSITGYFSGGGGRPNNTSQLSTGLQDTVNWTLGNHGLKFGGSFIFNKYQETAAFLSQSTASFTGAQTGNGSAANGNAFADFLLGRANNFQQNNGSLHRLHFNDPSLFVHDTWRVSRRFTVNGGVRWEVFYPFVGQKNFGTFIPGKQSTRFPTAPTGLVFEGDPGVPEGLISPSYLKFAPRIGFAWDIFGTGRTALRGGYGVFYSFSQEPFVGNLEGQPFALAVSVTNTTSYANPYAGQAAFPTGSPYPYVPDPANAKFNKSAQFAGIRPNTSAVPYVQQFNLTLEQQYGANWSTRMAYVGTLGRRFYLNRDQNAPVYIPGFCPGTSTTPCSSTASANVASRRPYNTMNASTAYGYTSNIAMLDPISNSSYNGLQLTATRRMLHNFAVQAAYTWSKALDIASGDPGSATTWNLVNNYDASLDKGLSNYHLPQKFVASVLYQLPSVKKWGLFGKEILSGWQINAIQTLASGQPFNVLSATDSNLDGLSGSDRPNLVGNPHLLNSRSKLEKINQYFNTAAFQNVPTTMVNGVRQLYGTSPRNPLIGPGTIRTDASAFKRFEIYERMNLLFRAEAFNLMNNTNLGNPNGSINAANFGKITSSDAPRQLQLALKLEF